MGGRCVGIDDDSLDSGSIVQERTGNVDVHAIMPRVSMIVALDTDGKVWFTLSHSNTDSNVMALFFTHLVQALDHDQAD